VTLVVETIVFIPRASECETRYESDEKNAEKFVVNPLFFLSLLN